MNDNLKCFCGRNAWQPVEGEKPYCIFHSPKVEEKKEDFITSWNNYLQNIDEKQRNYEGFIFPIDINNFSVMKFHFQTSFNNVVFRYNVDFKNAKFIKYTSFRNVKFFGETNFNHVHFFNDVYFNNSIFTTKASFFNTKFSKESSFENVDFTGAEISNASFTNCSFENVTYNLKPIKWEKPEKWWHFWNYHKLEKPIPPTNFTGIETAGIRAASNRQFVREIKDQQFLNQFKTCHPVLYKIWLVSCDCGRSFWLFLVWCFFVAIVFGIVYSIAGEKWFDNAGEWNWITPFYYSIVTFSTLGFGDISPKLSSSLGQIAVMLEVFLGYLGLGGLISIFANKLARRA